MSPNKNVNHFVNWFVLLFFFLYFCLLVFFYIQNIETLMTNTKRSHYIFSQGPTYIYLFAITTYTHPSPKKITGIDGRVLVRGHCIITQKLHWLHKYRVENT